MSPSELELRAYCGCPLAREVVPFFLARPKTNAGDWAMAVVVGTEKMHWDWIDGKDPILPLEIEPWVHGLLRAVKKMVAEAPKPWSYIDWLSEAISKMDTPSAHEQRLGICEIVLRGPPEERENDAC